MKYLIGLDIGTSAVKGALAAEDGRVIKVTDRKLTYITDGTFRLLDPDHFCETCFDAIAELAAAADGAIAALCCCHASGNPLFLDKDGKPLTRIIGWQSVIPWEDINAVYTKEEQNAFYRTVGWGFFNGMPAADLAYIKIHRPDVLENTSFLCMSAEYLNHKITGKWGISHSMGTPSYLMDQEKGVYNTAVLEKFGLSPEMLPPVFEKGTVLGTVLPGMAEKLGLSSDTKVVLGSFDHPSGALGAGVLQPGQLLLSCGTSWVELFPVQSREHALSTGGLVDRFALNGPKWCVMSSLESISDKIDERRDHFFGSVPHKYFDGLAGEAKPGSNGLVIDFTGEDYKRAEGHDKRDIARAILEGAARLLKNNLKDLEKCGLKADSITAIGGITNSKIAVGIISEVLQREIKVVNGQSAGAVGSCLLGGMGIGLYKNEAEAFGAMSSHLKV
ncbi:MAG: hypothetical protein IJT49_09980 [Clostridia bacterium]|nr:hypothetical protein [Clostridia bacterium]